LKKYYTMGGKERSIWQMIEEDPGWAANRIQAGEAAIEKLNLAIEKLKDLKSGGDIKDAIKDFLEFGNDMRRGGVHNGYYSDGGRPYEILKEYLTKL